MKLLDEKLVEEAAEFYAKIETNHTGQINRNIGFKSGVSFAEQQLKEKMIEFAEWISFNYTASDDIFCPIGCSDVSEWINAEQLLEQFLNKE